MTAVAIAVGTPGEIAVLERTVAEVLTDCITHRIMHTPEHPGKFAGGRDGFACYYFN